MVDRQKEDMARIEVERVGELADALSMVLSMMDEEVASATKHGGEKWVVTRRAPQYITLLFLIHSGLQEAKSRVADLIGEEEAT